MRARHAQALSTLCCSTAVFRLGEATYLTGLLPILMNQHPFLYYNRRDRLYWSVGRLCAVRCVRVSAARLQLDTALRGRVVSVAWLQTNSRSAILIIDILVTSLVLLLAATFALNRVPLFLETLQRGYWTQLR